MTKEAIPGPMSLIDIFDEAFDLYKRNAGLFILIILVIHIPGQIALDALTYQLFAGFVESRSRDPEVAFALVGKGILLAGATLIIYLLQAGPLTVAVSDRYLGHPTSFRRAYRGMLKTYPRLIITGLVTFLIALTASVIVLFALALVLGIVLSGIIASGRDDGISVILGLVVLVGMGLAIVAIGVWIFPFTVPACIVERLGPFASLARNGMLAAAGYWRLFRALIVLPIIWGTLVFAISQSGQFVFEFLVKPWMNPSFLTIYIVNSVWGTLTTTLISPFVIIFLTLLYYDARVRKEGFDLALLHRQMVEARE